MAEARVDLSPGEQHCPSVSVVLTRLPQEVCDILFAEDDSDPSVKISGLFRYDGKDIKISNSWKRRVFDVYPSSLLWTPVLPNIQSDDSGIGTEIGSDVSKYDEDNNKRIKRWKGPDEEGEYEVQEIVDHRHDKGNRDEFLVKWVGWGSQFNSWEPLIHLNCQDQLNVFMKKLTLHILTTKWRPVPRCKVLMDTAYRNVIDHFIESTPRRVCKELVKQGFKQKAFTIVFLSRMLNQAIHERNPRCREAIINSVKEHCAILRVRELRKNQMAMLKKWEDSLNQVGPGGLTVENQVDLEGPPKDFLYITQNKVGPGLDSCIMVGQVAGCLCTEECGNIVSCCPNQAGVDWAYSASGGLIVSPRSGIYECNRFCVCGPECPNRVVQNGRKVKLCIFKTANGRGWGLKAGEKIEKGAFLTTYLGEIITSEEAARRDINYEKTGLSYLFDLDMMDDDEGPMLTIDAMKCGNESHFINHSCNPNAHVAGVWIETNDPAIPLLALFAKRTIKRGEEITFDYQGDQDPRKRSSVSSATSNMKNEESGSSKPPTRKRAKKCKCGSRVCKGFYF